MSGRQRLRAQLARRVHQVGELHALIAAHAGDRRLAARIGLGEVGHDAVLEALFIVENIMRDAEALGHAARIVDVLAGAAGALLPGGTGIVELQRDADDVIALALQKRSRHRRIHAARHGGDDPGSLGKDGCGVHGVAIFRHAFGCKLAGRRRGRQEVEERQLAEFRCDLQGRLQRDLILAFLGKGGRQVDILDVRDEALVQRRQRLLLGRRVLELVEDDTVAGGYRIDRRRRVDRRRNFAVRKSLCALVSVVLPAKFPLGPASKAATSLSVCSKAVPASDASTPI